MNMTLKVLAVISMTLLFSSCFLGDSKIIRKKLKTNDITIKWYYYSYITNNSPDIVEVEKDGQIRELCRAVATLLDVDCNDKEILMKFVNQAEAPPFPQKIDVEVFGYKVVLDTTGSPRSLDSIPLGSKEWW